MNATELQHLLEVVFPGIVLVIFVGGFALRMTLKPMVEAMIRLREGMRSDRDQTQVRIAQLEAEVARLRAGESHGQRTLDDGSWSTEPLRRD
jgi:hypothetical protein